MGGRGTGSKLSTAKPKTRSQIAQSMSIPERIEWVKNITGVDDMEAQKIVEACKHYSLGGYRDIHNGNNAKEEALIDFLINHPNVPQFMGKTYRGVHIKSDLHGMTADEKIMSIINGGVWKEPGITSFSIDRSTAEDFADVSGTSKNTSKTGPRSVILESDNKSGMPFRHLSNLSYENEILMPSSVKHRGWDIQSWRREGNTYILKVKER